VATAAPSAVFQIAIVALYVLCLGALFLYGTNCYVLLFLFRRNRSKGREEYQNLLKKFDASRWRADLPTVTVQLPVYNERHVIRRLLQAACALDYPRDRLEIQLLDDSTDDTVEIARRLVAAYRQQGIAIEHVRRTSREGFKAGALKAGMENARGDFLAVFDADFVPPPDFLHKTLPYFLDPAVGMVQVRWSHLNADSSLLTYAQSVGIDSHFSIEQGARAWSGLFLNFNGTAGIWRRQAIVDAGGWQADTLTEDMDLSYRAQLAGWRLKYLLEVSCPAELPDQVSAFKSQQFRWAKGSIQTARKIIPELLKVRCPWFAKYQAILHMTHYVVHPLMLATLLLSYPAILLESRELNTQTLVCVFLLFLLSTLGPSALYVAAQKALYPNWRARLRRIPLMTLIGTGIALSNSRAVLEGLLVSGGKFIRTPKFGILSRINSGPRKKDDYRIKKDNLPYLELAIGLYALLTLAKAITSLGIVISPFLFMYTCGFFYISIKGISESRK
jgi:cellulose synthase/poly-beta-1,6-N-acetylglucosamine synthase-like glycosyltransferase